MKRTLTLATLIALGAAAYMPLSAVAQSNYTVVVETAPPVPRFESLPAPRAGYVWAPGFWDWNGYRHEWVAGRWERARDGYAWRPAEWQRNDRGYFLQHGGWVAVDERRHRGYRMAPPAPRYERIPAARRDYVWEPGHWEWRRGRYEWIKGGWISARAGYVYRPHEWRERDGRWYLDQPSWSRGGRDRDRNGVPDRMERGDRFDRDNDGIDDRYDRDIDNDGVNNRRDADRDGDGVYNEEDRRPDNERRY